MNCVDCELCWFAFPMYSNFCLFVHIYGLLCNTFIHPHWVKLYLIPAGIIPCMYSFFHLAEFTFNWKSIVICPLTWNKPNESLILFFTWSLVGEFRLLGCLHHVLNTRIINHLILLDLWPFKDPVDLSSLTWRKQMLNAS